MSYKKEIENVLDSLKNHGFDRDAIEKRLDYSKNYIDQQLSKGGNKKFLGSLKRLRDQILQKTIPSVDKDANINEADWGKSVTIESLMQQQNKLINSLNRQSELSSTILQRMADNVEKKVESIDINLNDALGRVDSLKLDLYSGRMVVLQSLARLEKKPVNSLLAEADNIIAAYLNEHLQKQGTKGGKRK